MKKQYTNLIGKWIIMNKTDNNKTFAHRKIASMSKLDYLILLKKTMMKSN